MYACAAHGSRCACDYFQQHVLSRFIGLGIIAVFVMIVIYVPNMVSAVIVFDSGSLMRAPIPIGVTLVSRI